MLADICDTRPVFRESLLILGGGCKFFIIGLCDCLILINHLKLYVKPVNDVNKNNLKIGHTLVKVFFSDKPDCILSRDSHKFAISLKASVTGNHTCIVKASAIFHNNRTIQYKVCPRFYGKCGVFGNHQSVALRNFKCFVRCKLEIFCQLKYVNIISFHKLKNIIIRRFIKITNQVFTSLRIHLYVILLPATQRAGAVLPCHMRRTCMQDGKSGRNVTVYTCNLMSQNCLRQIQLRCEGGFLNGGDMRRSVLLYGIGDVAPRILCSRQLCKGSRVRQIEIIDLIPCNATAVVFNRTRIVKDQIHHFSGRVVAEFCRRIVRMHAQFRGQCIVKGYRQILILIFRCADKRVSVQASSVDTHLFQHSCIFKRPVSHLCHIGRQIQTLNGNIGKSTLSD